MCASLLFGGGKNIKQVQEWLGHADPSFTLRTYVHLLDEGLGDADFLDELVGPEHEQSSSVACVTNIDPTADEHRLADLELRTEQERATFDLYEHRRLAVETQATALTAAAPDGRRPSATGVRGSVWARGRAAMGSARCAGRADLGPGVRLPRAVRVMGHAEEIRWPDGALPRRSQADFGRAARGDGGDRFGGAASARARALERSRDQRVEAGGVQVQAVEGGTVGAGPPGAVPGAGRWRPARASDRQRRQTRGSGQRWGNTQAATSRKRAEKRDAEPAPVERNSRPAVNRRERRGELIIRRSEVRFLPGPHRETRSQSGFLFTQACCQSTLGPPSGPPALRWRRYRLASGEPNVGVGARRQGEVFEDAAKQGEEMLCSPPRSGESHRCRAVSMAPARLRPQRAGATRHQGDLHGRPRTMRRRP
jgi:hypothetical protein